MALGMLYNADALFDVVIVLKFIDSFTAKLGVKDVGIDPDVIQSIVKGCRQDFPYDGGVERASAFKQVANFVCFFCAERPLPDPFPREIIGDRLADINNHQNAMVAFAFAEAALHQSKIQRKDGEFIVENPIEYSQHSYVDIIEALSNISPSTHWKLVTVLLEQLVYKTNPECQYEIIKP